MTDTWLYPPDLRDALAGFGLAPRTDTPPALVRDAVSDLYRYEIRQLRDSFWKDVRVAGECEELNQSLEKAGRVADFFELAELMCRDALHRNESCGGHFREEYETPEGEAQRNDDQFSYVAAWNWEGEGKPHSLHKEPLTFEYVHPSQRSYK